MSGGRYLLCTDLDRTLIPNGPAEESPRAAGFFARLAADPRVTLAYVSGRHRTLIEDAIATYDLPAPDYVIADVGTTHWGCNLEQREAVSANGSLWTNCRSDGRPINQASSRTDYFRAFRVFRG